MKGVGIVGLVESTHSPSFVPNAKIRNGVYQEQKKGATIVAKYRPIQVRMWKDPDFEEYNANMKLIFIYLCTNTLTTESGIYAISTKTISQETDIPHKTVTKLLSNGYKNICYDFENNCVFVKNFLKHSVGGRPELILKSIQSNHKDFDTPLWNEFIKRYPQHSKGLQRVDKPLNKGSIEIEIENRNRNRNRDRDRDSNREVEKKEKNTPLQKIIEYYNNHRNNMPETKMLTPGRKNAIRLRYKEYGDELFTLFEKAGKSDFLNGMKKNNRTDSDNFIASFDWLLKPANAIKVLEGNYDNKDTSKEKKIHYVN